jgi:hypothetical protein
LILACLACRSTCLICRSACLVCRSACRSACLVCRSACRLACLRLLHLSTWLALVMPAPHDNAKAAATTNPVSRPHQAAAFVVCRCLPLLPPMAWSLALLPLWLRLLPLLLRLSLQPSPSRAATAVAGAILLKALPHHSLRRRSGRRSDAIDASSTP